MLTKYRLMIPGPTPVPPDVAAAGSLPVTDERIPAFAALYERVCRHLGQIMGTSGEVLIFASSTTGAMESAIANLFSAGDRILVVNNGFFAERWLALSRAYGLQPVEQVQPWGTVADCGRVAAMLAADPSIRAAVCVHCETSTGAVSDLAAFGAASRGVLSIVDAASSLGASPVAADACGIDVMVGGCQKALMTPPGLSFVCVSDPAWDACRTATLPRFYFDWLTARAAVRDRGATPWTPAVGLIVQLDLALRQLLDEGMAEAARRHVLLGRATRAAVRALGLTTLAGDDDANSVVTAAVLPDGLSSRAVAAAMLAENGVQVTVGNGGMADRVVRIGHCGYIDRYDVLTAVSALEDVLRQSGHPVGCGAAAAAVMAAFHPAGMTADGQG